MRHAFWRSPTGAIHRSQDDTHSPKALLAQIGEIVTVKDGAISWPNFGFLQIKTTVYPSVAIIGPDQCELNEIDSGEIVEAAVREEIFRLGGGQPIEPSKVLRLVNKKAAEFFKKPKKRRLLITSLSIDGLAKFPIKLAKAEITDANRQDFPFPQELRERESYLTQHLTETKYRTVSVSTNQFSIHQAFEIGITTLNYLRGLWNLIATFKRISYHFETVPERKWIGVVHLGPLHMLHSLDDKEDPGWWYEADYIDDTAIFSPAHGWNGFEEQRIKLTDWIEALPYKEEMIRLMARYAIALDQANLDVCLLMLWSLLEKITDTVGGNYDVTIKRAVWGYPQRAIAKELLNQMRWRRNRFVHAAGTSDKRDQLCYITKSFVDGHLLALIRNDFKISSITEYAQFLSLPHTTKRLSQMRDWYQQALDNFLKAQKVDSSPSGPNSQAPN